MPNHQNLKLSRRVLPCLMTQEQESKGMRAGTTELVRIINGCGLL